ncbi:MAG: PH domain-containing protein [Oscillospiraceae bacterium]|nr:PH domain-containing protein [Oscillospiraceae bacterium]
MNQKPPDQQYSSLPKRGLLIRQIVSSAVFGAVLFLYMVILPQYTQYWLLLSIPLVLLFAAVTFALLPLLHKRRAYFVTHETISYKSGLFVQSVKTIRSDKILLAELAMSPLASLLKTASLTLYTPGTKLRIPYLEPETAEHLKDSLTGGAV